MSPEQPVFSESVKELLLLSHTESMDAGRVYAHIEHSVADGMSDEFAIATTLLLAEKKLSDPSYDPISSARGVIEGITEYLLDTYEDDTLEIILEQLLDSAHRDFLLVEFSLSLSRNENPALSSKMRHNGSVTNTDALEKMVAGESLEYARQKNLDMALGILVGNIGNTALASEVRSAVNQLSKHD